MEEVKTSFKVGEWNQMKWGEETDEVPGERAIKQCRNEEAVSMMDCVTM